MAREEVLWLLELESEGRTRGSPGLIHHSLGKGGQVGIDPVCIRLEAERCARCFFRLLLRVMQRRDPGI